MRTLLIIAIIVLSVSKVEAFDKWTKTDVSLQAIYTILHVIDWGQTLEIARNPVEYETGTSPTGEQYQYSIKRTETNFILGPNPSVASVNKYFAATLIAHTVISHILPDNYRTIWQGATIALEVYAVGGNYRAGINGFF